MKQAIVRSLWGLTLGVLAHGQAASQAAGEAEGPPVLSLEDLQLQFYEVQHQNAQGLATAVGEMLGRDFFVSERGGRRAEPVRNIRSLGDTVLVYDEPENVVRILSACREIDQQATSGAAALETFEYRPRYVELDALYEYLEPFSPRIRTPGGGRTPRLAAVEERGLITLRGSPEELRRLRSMIERFDQPEQQVLIRCHLLRTADDASPEGLPEELLANLRELVPQYRFEAMGFALLQSSVSPKSQVSLHLGQYQSRSYALTFRPVAYDPETALLTVERCKLIESWTSRPREDDASPAAREVFSTDIVFGGSEYTVIGGSGHEPVFVVIRVEGR